MQREYIYLPGRYGCLPLRLLRKRACTVVRRPGAISPELAAAQEQLVLRRQERRQERFSQRLPVKTDAHGRLNRPNPTGSPESDPVNHRDSFPGWESTRLTEALAAASKRRRQQQARASAQTLSWLPSPTPPAKPQAAIIPERRDDVRLYPDLAMAMLQQQEVAAGRIWFLLRHLDHSGRGWIEVAEARAHLTGKGSPLRVCSWRQLRNLLAQGEGLFWIRDAHTAEDARIWLRGLTRVLSAFGVRRLSLRPVILPVKILTETIGTVRAHFYASFHSGRPDQRPVARETLADISSVSRRTQRTYEKKAGVRRQQNWVIGPRRTPEAVQEEAWKRGKALFTFTDEAGTYGQPGQSYLAWQLPNSYAGPHTPQARGHQKQINRKLADLFMKGITGNGTQEVEPQPALQDRRLPARFYAHGEKAVRASNHTPATEHYWQTHQRQRQARVWHLLLVKGESK